MIAMDTYNAYLKQIKLNISKKMNYIIIMYYVYFVSIKFDC